MFEKKLADSLKRIFNYSKVSYQKPSDEHEQDCLFLTVEVSNSVARDGMLFAQVKGHCTVYSNYEKIPFGYFSKRIALADLSDTKDLFFYDVDKNIQIYEKLVERSFSFIYFFSGQYDPDNGTLTSIDTEVITT